MDTQDLMILLYILGALLIAGGFAWFFLHDER